MAVRAAARGAPTESAERADRPGTCWYLSRLRVSPAAAVEQAVDAQRGPAGEGLAAVLAHVGLVAAVEDHVLLQVPLQAVALVAVGAGEGTHASVTHLQVDTARRKS